MNKEMKEAIRKVRKHFANCNKFYNSVEDLNKEFKSFYINATTVKEKIVFRAVIKNVKYVRYFTFDEFNPETIVMISKPNRFFTTSHWKEAKKDLRKHKPMNVILETLHYVPGDAKWFTVSKLNYNIFKGDK